MSSPLFEHLAEVEQEVRAASHLLLGLDFDGTLAPIVPQPADAQIPADTRSVLEGLALRPDMTVAVVSGRALSDLITRTGIDVIFAGNHGLEIKGDGFDFLHPQAAAWQITLHQMCEEIRLRLACVPGSLVEDKGLTATVHSRNVAESDREELASVVRAVVEPHCEHFELREGKKTIEILPRVSWNKGKAMCWLREQLEETRLKNNKSLSLCYIGDDATDEDVFRASLFAPSRGITIRVGSGCPTAARFTVSDPGEVTEFLQWLSRSVLR